MKPIVERVPAFAPGKTHGLTASMKSQHGPGQSRRDNPLMRKEGPGTRLIRSSRHKVSLR